MKAKLVRTESNKEGVWFLIYKDNIVTDAKRNYAEAKEIFEKMKNDNEVQKVLDEFET